MSDNKSFRRGQALVLWYWHLILLHTTQPGLFFVNQPKDSTENNLNFTEKTGVFEQNSSDFFGENSGGN